MRKTRKTLAEYQNELWLSSIEALKPKVVSEMDTATNQPVEYIMKPQIEKYVVPHEMWNLLLRDRYFKKLVDAGHPRYGGYNIEAGEVTEPAVKVVYSKQRRPSHKKIKKTSIPFI